MFGDPMRGNERMLLRLDPNGDASVADSGPVGIEWQLLSAWDTRRGRLSFLDSRSGRMFEADLDYSSLGGRWHDPVRAGGWWCLPAPAQTARAGGEPLLPPLIPAVAATPWYPRQAVRAAKEGNAVACFTVGADGVIRDPVLIELSDEMFRNPTLSALQRSRYMPWNSAIAARPGCRSFSYELQSRY